MDQGVSTQSLDAGVISTSAFTNRLGSRTLPNFLEAHRSVTLDVKTHRPESAESRKKASCEKALKTNPFTTYRDPETGRWMVVKGSSYKN